MRSKSVSVLSKVLPALLCAILLVGLAAAADCSPYFALDTELSWQTAFTENISPMTAPEWGDYMHQWQDCLVEGEPYPANLFLPPELYVYGGGGEGGLDPEEPGLVMVWGDSENNPGSYSSAWKYDYNLDPNLNNTVITLTITAPQFNPIGNQINVVSFGIQDIAGNIRSWQWQCGPGQPIPWNTATQITLTPAVQSVNAAVPTASGFANNPLFNIVNSQLFIVDENATWVGGPALVPPPGGTVPRIWNYWSNVTVMPSSSQFDWGDAPDPTYPTLAASNGARHVTGNLVLGTLIDPEQNGQPHPQALGDDLAGTPDEDGVVFTTPLIPGATVTVNATASGPGRLDAWIDFAGDGSWAQPGDRIFAAVPLTAGLNVLTFAVPPTAVPGTTTFARFRLSTSGGLSFIGAAMDGEVEDYMVTIAHSQEERFDWGDASDPSFPTLAASNGANHKIVSGRFLGMLIDAEPNGQPNATATGDDNNGASDEDGVVFGGSLLPGGPATVTITASMPGFVDAWIDFNGNGTWANPGEQILVSGPVIAGPNVFTFPVPAGAVPGTTVFSRFRYSSTGGLSFVGSAPDGEVEDYAVKIGYKWIQKPDLSTDGIDVNATAPYILADDFQCNVTGPITDIHVWGSWYHDILPEQNPGMVKFKLSIHKDVPATPDTYSHPGELLWYHEFQPGEFTVRKYADEIDEGWMDPPSLYEFPGDHGCWQYDFDISQFPFYQTGTEQIPVVYWLDVQAEPLEPGARFGWKTSLSHWNDDACWAQGVEPYNGPWNELRYPPQHEHQGKSIDLAFAITGTAQQPPQPGRLSVTYNRIVADHIWWPTPDEDNEMISLTVAADPTEAIAWNSIRLQALGSGNDATDIAAANLWLDNNNDAIVDPADSLIGTGVYATDNGILTIPLLSAQLIPAGSSVSVLVSYTMSPTAAYGSNYQFDVTSVIGAGQTSGAVISAMIAPTPLRSALKTASTAPIKIGDAKKLPAGTGFLLVDKEITADFMAPTWPHPWNWFYIEEPDRSQGIGVIGGLTGPLHVGDRVMIMGTTSLVNGCELMISPTLIYVTHHAPSVLPMAMNTRATGGALFGLQPAVADNATMIPVFWSHGLNNVGMLIRTCGQITGSGGVNIGGGSMVDVVWLDDGAALKDGYTTTGGDLSQGVAVVVPSGAPAPLSGYYMVNGILRAIPDPMGNPVRLLVPRDYANDMTPCSP